MHAAYFAAGADVATTSSYQASVPGLVAAGYDGRRGTADRAQRRAGGAGARRDGRRTERCAAARRRLGRAVRSGAGRRLGEHRPLRTDPAEPRTSTHPASSCWPRPGPTCWPSRRSPTSRRPRCWCRCSTRVDPAGVAPPFVGRRRAHGGRVSRWSDAFAVAAHSAAVLAVGVNGLRCPRPPDGPAHGVRRDGQALVRPTPTAGSPGTAPPTTGSDPGPGTIRLVSTAGSRPAPVSWVAATPRRPGRTSPRSPPVCGTPEAPARRSAGRGPGERPAALVAAQDPGRPPGAAPADQREVGEALEQRPQPDLALHPGQRGAEAVVAPAENDDVVAGVGAARRRSGPGRRRPRGRGWRRRAASVTTDARAARPARRPRCRAAATRPVSSTGGSTRSTSSTAFGHSAGSARSTRAAGRGARCSSAMPLPSRLTVVSKPAASTRPAVAISSASLSRSPSSSRGDQLAHQVVAGVRAQPVEVGGQPGRGTRQAALDAAELAPAPARGRGSARPRCAERAAPRSRSSAGTPRISAITVTGSRPQYAATRSTGVGAAVELVEQLVGDLLGRGRAAPRPPARVKTRGDELAVAGVVRRLGDEQRRRGRAGPRRPGSSAQRAEPAEHALAGVEDAGAEVVAGEHLLDRRERGGDVGEGAAVQRAVGAHLVGDRGHGRGVHAPTRGDEPALDVPAGGLPAHHDAGEAVGQRPPDALLHGSDHVRTLGRPHRGAPGNVGQHTPGSGQGAGAYSGDVKLERRHALTLLARSRPGTS